MTSDLMVLMDSIHDQFFVISDSVCFEESQAIFNVMNFVPRRKRPVKRHVNCKLPLALAEIKKKNLILSRAFGCALMLQTSVLQSLCVWNCQQESAQYLFAVH